MNEFTSATESTGSTESTESTPRMYETPSDIKRIVVSEDEMEKNSAVIEDAIYVCDQADIPITYTFDPAQPAPDGYSLTLIPMTETNPEGARSMAGLIVGALPPAEQILAAPAGAAWAVKTLTDKLVAQLKSAVQKALPGEKLPLTVSEFVATGKSSLFAGFSRVAPEYVKALKKKSPQLSFLSVPLLRQILASAQFAEQQFPRIAQKNWEHIINAMMNTCELEGVDVGILPKWLETRDTVEVAATDVDLQDIGDLINADHDKEVS